MTVKDIIDKIKTTKVYSKFLDQLADKEQDEHIKDYLTESSRLLKEYVDVLEQIKNQLRWWNRQT